MSKEKTIFVRAIKERDLYCFLGDKSFEPTEHLKYVLGAGFSKEELEKFLIDTQLPYEIEGEKELVLKALGVNAFALEVENFETATLIEKLEEVFIDFQIMGYDENFVYVFFEGKNLGSNLMDDGDIVRPEKIIFVHHL